MRKMRPTEAVIGFIAVVHILIGLWLVAAVDGSGMAIGATVLLIVSAVLARRARTGSAQENIAKAMTVVGVLLFWTGTHPFPWGWLNIAVALVVIAAGFVGTRMRVLIAKEKARRAFGGSGLRNAGLAIAVLAVLGSLFGVIALSYNGADDTVSGPFTAQVDGQQLEIRNASLEDDLVGPGVNVATPPVLNDGKGLLTSWANYYDRTQALAPASKANVIRNTNTWADATRRMHKESWLWFPYWTDIENTLRFIPGEFRVIAKVMTDKSNDEAKNAVYSHYPDLPRDLPVVKVEGALVNSACSNNDCNQSPSPAQQFVDTNGQVRVVLTNPIQGKEGHWVVNIEAVRYGVGLGTECWNGFLGARNVAPEVIQQVKDKKATGNGSSTTVVTTTPSTPSTTPSTTPPTTTPSTTPPTTTPSTTPPTTTPKDTDPSSYTVIPDAPKATVTGPAAPPTTPATPAGTTPPGAPIPTGVDAPGATPTEIPTLPTGNAGPSQTGGPTAPATGDQDPDGVPAPQPQAAQVPAPQEQAPSPHSVAVVPLAPAPVEPADQPAPAPQAPATIAPAPEPTPAPAPAPQSAAPAAPSPAPQTQQAPKPEPVQPAPATQQKQAPTQQKPSVATADVEPTASSHPTNNGITVIYIIGAGTMLGAGIGGGYYIHRRRKSGKLAHKA